MTKVGSSPASASTLATRLVVVVLPCVPAMAMPCFRRISSASISARGTTGMRFARAATTSGLSACTAVEVTTASAPAMCAASWPTKTVMPRPARRRGRRAVRQVGARDLVAEVEQHFGDAAHAGAADADEMNMLDRVLHAATAAASHASDDGVDRVGLAPSRWAFTAISKQGIAPGLLQQVGQRFWREFGLLQTSQPPPASTSKRALSGWWSSTAEERHEQRCYADGRDFGHGDRAGAATIRSASA